MIEHVMHLLVCVSTVFVVWTEILFFFTLTSSVHFSFVHGRRVTREFSPP